MAEDTLQKGQKQHTPATIPPKQVEEAAAVVESEPEADDMMMEEAAESMCSCSGTMKAWWFFQTPNT